MSLNKYLLRSAAVGALCFTTSVAAIAQVEVTDTRTTGIATSSADDGAAGDVTVTDTGRIEVTTGAGVTVDSDNDATVAGVIAIEDADNTTGILVEGGNSGTVSLTGDILISETYDPEDVDGDAVIDGPFAVGTGRTGILITGASPFTGDIFAATGSRIQIEGNDSAGIRLAGTTTLDGNLISSASMEIRGDNAVGVDVAGDVVGDVTIGGGIRTGGEGASAVRIGGDVDGRVTLNGASVSSGYRFAARQFRTIRALYDDEDTLEGGNTVRVSGDVSNGVIFEATRSDEGVITGIPSVSQGGVAAAVLIAGDGTPIVIGLLADITDPTDEAFEERLQYSFVNEGTIASSGVLDDRSATALHFQDAQLTNGFSNSGQITASTFRSGVPTDATTNVAGNVAPALAVRFSSGADIGTLDNVGTIRANASDAADLIYEDPDNPLGDNGVFATGILIESGASVTEINNGGTIAAILSGRSGAAYALVDQSGSLAVINNEGIIFSAGATSDTEASSTDTPPVFTLVAIDVSASANGVTINHRTAVDTDPDDDFTPAAPVIIGDILLGSGDDTLNATSGNILGDVAFGDGSDALILSGGTTLTGSVTDSDGLLTLDVSGGSSLVLTEAVPLNVTTASFGSDTTFSTVIDGGANGVSTLNASGQVTFESGALISTSLSNLIGQGGAFTLVSAGSLSLGDDISNYQLEDAPFLYNTAVTRIGDDLVATLSLRDPSLSAAQGGLGLDSTQAQAFNEAFGAMLASAELGSAFAGLTTESEFNSAFNQIMPEFNAAAGRFVFSNVDGATGAVATHLNNARASDERPGGAWIQEFAYYADRELVGLSDAYRGYGFGFTGGFDTAFGPFHTAGVNFSYSATEVEDVVGIDDPLNVSTFQGGLYGGIERGNFFADGYVGGGYNSFESRRNVTIGSFARQAEGSWSGTHYNATGSVGYDFALGERYFLRPTATVNYLSLTEEGYSESGSDAIRLNVEERQSDYGSATGLINFGARFEGDRIWYAPSARIGYRNDFANDAILTSSSFASTGSRFDITSQEFPDNGIVMGITFMAGSRYSSFGFDYDADIRDGYNRHTARLVLRMLF